MQVLVADSLAKVLREPERGERPLMEGSARISAARNERESFQVVVVAGGQPLQGVTVAGSEVRQEDGDGMIPASRIAVNPVGYVETTRPAYEVDRVGWWPDPLMPPGPVTVERGQRQPFWVTVYVPESAPAGEYRGAITVCAEGETDHQVPLELKVWDFTLAPTPALPSAIAIYSHSLAGFYNEDPIPEPVLRRFWDMLFTHRLSSDDLGNPIEEGVGAVIDGRAEPPFDYSTFDKRLEYCFARGLTAVMAARLPGFLEEGPDLTPDEQDRLVAYLNDLAQHLDSRGWLDRAFVMVWDEPREQFATHVLKELQVVRRAHPKLRSRLDGPVTGPLVERCQQEVDIWGLHMLNIAHGAGEAEANIERWRRENRALWMYVACDTHHPYPNIFIDYPLMDSRMLPWLCWRYDIGCLLYWSANYFGEGNVVGNDPREKWPKRPWVSGNFIEGWGGRRNVYNGDGHLIYPGPDGMPLSSVRLEALRDGMEDYDYLWLLESGLRMLEKAGVEPEVAAEARRWLESQQVVTSFTEWERDPEALLKARAGLAGLVERVYQSALH
jgi:hypothetical protein